MSKVLVTGAHGLAGSAAVEHLRDRGYTVMPLTHADVDLRNIEATGRYFDAIRPDYVFHAAATVYGLKGNMANQAKSIVENTLINTSVIDNSARVGVKKIIAMGTNAIYPWPAKLPYQVENIFDGRPHAMESGYGHAKRHMLAMLEAYRYSSNMEYVYLVSGNLYGPRDRFNTETGHVLPSLIKKFYDAANRPILGANHIRDEDRWGIVNVWGDGSATRDFLYSGDLARIVRMAIETPINPAAINIGSGQQASIEYVCKRLSSISGLPYDRVRYDVNQPTGRPDCYADLTHLRDKLLFAPMWNLGEGLRATYDWYAHKRATSPAGPTPD